jgi:hypothetical protein
MERNKKGQFERLGKIKNTEKKATAWNIYIYIGGRWNLKVHLLYYFFRIVRNGNKSMTILRLRHQHNLHGPRHRFVCVCESVKRRQK